MVTVTTLLTLPPAPRRPRARVATAAAQEQPDRRVEIAKRVLRPARVGLSGLPMPGAPAVARFDPPALQDVLAARRVIKRHSEPTPLRTYPNLSRLVGAEVWVKHETFPPMGAFNRHPALWRAVGEFR